MSERLRIYRSPEESGGSGSKPPEKQVTPTEESEKAMPEAVEGRVQQLREAHAKWKEQRDAVEDPEERKRFKFNSRWLQRNGFSGLTTWSYQKDNLLLEELAQAAGSEVAEDFKKRELVYDRTEESAVAELQDAHAKWKEQRDGIENLEERKRSKFNQYWLENNGFRGLVFWSKGTSRPLLAVLAQTAGSEVAEDFKRQEQTYNRTKESAVAELQDAHAKWKEQRDGIKDLKKLGRFTFSPEWLKNNGFKPLKSWSIGKNHISLKMLAQAAGSEVAEDFKKREHVYDRTEESAVAELQDAHAKWKEQRDSIENPEERKQLKFNPDWLRRNGFHNFETWSRRKDHPSLEELARAAGEEVAEDFTRQAQRSRAEVEQAMAEEEEKRKHEEDLKRMIADMFTDGSEDAVRFRQLLQRYRGSLAADLLLQFHPRFKDVPIEKIGAFLADYIGDSLPGLQGRASRPDYGGLATTIREHPSLLELEILIEKQECLQYYYEQRKAGSLKSDSQIIEDYFENVARQQADDPESVIDEAALQAVTYFDGLFRDITKPDHLTESLGGEREFPDVNQRINARELRDKKNLLIADEMGLGKSASAIFAKEYLGVKCALITAPKNVLGTWMRYLSSDPEAGGCFKPGKEPRVLLVESHADLKGVDTSTYDYVLISHERLNEHHIEGLRELNFDMMIVDEVHKLKATKGVRASAMLELAGKIQEQQNYVALLSGTPVPNRVSDIANLLKLLHPKKYSKQSPARIRRDILDRHLIDLRTELTPYLQMKRLEDLVEMPEQVEAVQPVRLSPIERDTYDALLEQDELTALSKLHDLRAFLINPKLVEMVPEMKSSKIAMVREELNEAFQREDKILMFVNEFVQDVIRGEQAILDDLDLDPSVTILRIHGEVGIEEREEIQRQFQNGNGKILLLVSGQTADVGVNFSAAESVYFYNEPWNHATKRQQIARAYRPGRTKPLRVNTFITFGTAEEGIHRLIQMKYTAIEKLLLGIPPTEREKTLLKRGDQESAGGDIDVDPDIARFYLSAWRKLTDIVKGMKNIGEKNFKKYLEGQGSEYAELYKEIGRRSYQANANRVAGTLVDRFAREKEQDVNELRVLDLASGPQMLRRHIPEKYRRAIVSLDLNAEHFRDAEPEDETVVGSFLHTPFDANSFDYVNLSFGLHYTSFAPSQGQHERVQALREINRVLKTEGRAVIIMTSSDRFNDRKAFERIADIMGLRIVPEYSGHTDSGDGHFESWTYTLEKVTHCEKDTEEIIAEIQKEEIAGGLKFGKKKSSLKDTRHTITQFWINDRNLQASLNDEDRRIREEEVKIIEQGEKLKEQFGHIGDIHPLAVVQHGFSRVRSGNKYILFKKLESGPGAVVIHD